MKELRWYSNIIDYASHPAYRDVVSSAGIIDRLAVLFSFSGTFAVLILKRIIRYEMIPYHIRKKLGVRLASAALRNLFSFNCGRAPSGGRLGQRLDQDGIAVIQLAQSEFVKVERAAHESFMTLAKHRLGASGGNRAFDEARSTASREESLKLIQRVEHALHASGVMSAAGAYLGRIVSLVDINPQINDTSDNFWREVFPDLDLDETPPMAYYHRDASGGDLKAIFYMSDVSSENGPFNYAVGSHRLNPSKLDDLICEANNFCLSDTSPAMRRRFAALPAKLRQKGSFGNDLLPSSPLTDAIWRSGWSVEGKKGSIVLFDTKGIHRGGMVEDGERRVLTCVLG